jgi:hypothetical protein
LVADVTQLREIEAEPQVLLHKVAAVAVAEATVVLVEPAPVDPQAEQADPQDQELQAHIQEVQQHMQLVAPAEVMQVVAQEHPAQLIQEMAVAVAEVLTHQHRAVVTAAAEVQVS